MSFLDKCWQLLQFFNVLKDCSSVPFMLTLGCKLATPKLVCRGSYIESFPIQFFSTAEHVHLFSLNPSCIFLFIVFYSRTAIAGAIIGLLLVLFYFVVRFNFLSFLLRSYDVTATFYSFVHAISTSACVMLFFSLSVTRVFSSRDYIFVRTWLTSLSKMTSSLWNWLLFTLIQRHKVNKWVFFTLNDGYLTAANRGSKNLFRLLIRK